MPESGFLTRRRDLEGGNLRIKVTGFGFALILARNDMNSKRLMFCGTDAHMPPQSLFDLPTDVYSLRSCCSSSPSLPG